MDYDKRFLNATSVREKTAESQWQLFIEIWPSAYSGYHEILRVDSETSFMTKNFVEAADCSVVVVQESYIEAHNALGVGEWYHEPLRRVYAAVLNTDGTIRGLLVLRIAIEALNDTMGPKGLVPSLLVFG